MLKPRNSLASVAEQLYLGIRDGDILLSQEVEDLAPRLRRIEHILHENRKTASARETELILNRRHAAEQIEATQNELRKKEQSHKEEVLKLRTEADRLEQEIKNLNAAREKDRSNAIAEERFRLQDVALAIFPALPILLGLTGRKGTSETPWLLWAKHVSELVEERPTRYEADVVTLCAQFLESYPDWRYDDEWWRYENERWRYEDERRYSFDSVSRLIQLLRIHLGTDFAFKAAAAIGMKEELESLLSKKKEAKRTARPRDMRSRPTPYAFVICYAWEIIEALSYRAWRPRGRDPISRYRRHRPFFGDEIGPPDRESNTDILNFACAVAFLAELRLLEALSDTGLEAS